MHPTHLAFIKHLIRKHGHELGFVTPAIAEKFWRWGRSCLVLFNSQPAAWCAWGARPDVCQIYYAAVPKDARRLHAGAAAIATCTAWALIRGTTRLRLWCAVDLESNLFWRALGFEPICIDAASKAGDRKRFLYTQKIDPNRINPLLRFNPLWLPQEPHSESSCGCVGLVLPETSDLLQCGPLAAANSPSCCEAPQPNRPHPPNANSATDWRSLCRRGTALLKHNRTFGTASRRKHLCAPPDSTSLSPLLLTPTTAPLLLRAETPA